MIHTAFLILKNITKCVPGGTHYNHKLGINPKKNNMKTMSILMQGKSQVEN